MVQKVTSLREAIAVLMELERTCSLCLHYSAGSEEWERFEDAMEYLRLRVAKFVE